MGSHLTFRCFAHSSDGRGLDGYGLDVKGIVLWLAAVLDESPLQPSNRHTESCVCVCVHVSISTQCYHVVSTALSACVHGDAHV